MDGQIQQMSRFGIS